MLLVAFVLGEEEKVFNVAHCRTSMRVSFTSSAVLYIPVFGEFLVV